MNDNNIVSNKMSSENICQFAKNIISDCIDTCIERCIQIENEKNITGFYLLKYHTKTKKYYSNLIEYSSILPDFNERNYFLIDILNNSTEHLQDILPIPVLNGKYLKENVCINNLENKLLIIFISMKDIDTTSTFSYFMNALNSSNIDFNMFNNSNTTMSETITNSLQNFSLIPSVSLNNTENITNENIITPNNTTSLNNHRDTYRDQIEQMKAMGFTNEYKIIESLIVSDGDVNSAINYYLQ